MSFLGLLLLYSAPTLTAIGVTALLKRKFNPSYIFFVLSVLILLIFLTCIVFPYYMQGYRELKEAQPGPALGLTALPFIGTFAYLYSSIPLGFAWLSSGLSILFLSNVCANKKIGSILKIALALGYSFCLLNLHNFQVIGTVLE